MKENIVFGFLGNERDKAGPEDTHKWRPTLSIFDKQNRESFPVTRLHLFYTDEEFAHSAQGEIQKKSPETEVALHKVPFNDRDLWDIPKLFSYLKAFFESGDLKDDLQEACYFHITTGTRSWHITSFLLIEKGIFPGKILQTIPDYYRSNKSIGYSIEDIRSQEYDPVINAARKPVQSDISVLGNGVDNEDIKKILEEIDDIVKLSEDSILLLGETGTGKSKLARNIYGILKKSYEEEHGKKPYGKFIEINCSTLHGEFLMAELYGYAEGAFTGARKGGMTGAFESAGNGILFLDEIGELKLEEQAKILTTLDSRDPKTKKYRFRKWQSNYDSDEIESRCRLFFGTNKNLIEEVKAGRFREDLYARISDHVFVLPPLRERPEDFKKQIPKIFADWAENEGERFEFNTEAQEEYLKFAKEPGSTWRFNFRDLNGSIERMCVDARRFNVSRINTEIVAAEIKRLKEKWGRFGNEKKPDSRIPDDRNAIDRAALEYILKICEESKTRTEAGRKLYDKKPEDFNFPAQVNSLLKQYNLTWEEVKGKG